jgi:hypothetical protein
MTASIGDDQVSSKYAYAGVKGAGSEDAGSGKSWKSNEALSTLSGYNRSAYGHQSAKSMTGTARTFASSVAERSNASNIGGSGGVKLQAASRAPSSGPTYGAPVVSFTVNQPSYALKATTQKQYTQLTIHRCPWGTVSENMRMRGGLILTRRRVTMMMRVREMMTQSFEAEVHLL